MDPPARFSYRKGRKMLQKLGLGTLAELDNGRLAGEFNEDLATLARDCRDRPLLATARRLTLTIDIKPVPPASGAGPVGTSVTATMDTSIPKRKTTAYAMELTLDDALQFRADSPEDPQQTTLADEAARKDDEVPSAPDVTAPIANSDAASAGDGEGGAVS